MKVISYALWGNDSRYITPLLKNLKIAIHLFSEWKIIVYVSDSLNSSIKEDIRKLGATVYENGESPDTRGSFWRLKAFGLPNVEAVLFRDADSLLTLRDKEMVDYWLNSDKDFYLYRDHPFHCRPIIAGLWGARGTGIKKISFISSYDPEYSQYGDDEKFLAQMVYLKHRRDFLVFAPFVRYRGENVANWNLPRQSPQDYLGRVDSEEAKSGDKAMEPLWQQLTPKCHVRYLIPYTRSWKICHWLGAKILRKKSLQHWRDFSKEMRS